MNDCMKCGRFGGKCQTCREEEALQAHERLLAILPVRTCQQLTECEKKANTVVTDELVSQMREAESRGMTRFNIAIQFGVAGATVSRRLGKKRKCSRR